MSGGIAVLHGFFKKMQLPTWGNVVPYRPRYVSGGYILRFHELQPSYCYATHPTKLPSGSYKMSLFKYNKIPFQTFDVKITRLSDIRADDIVNDGRCTNRFCIHKAALGWLEEASSSEYIDHVPRVKHAAIVYDDDGAFMFPQRQPRHPTLSSTKKRKSR